MKGNANLMSISVREELDTSVDLLRSCDNVGMGANILDNFRSTQRRKGICKDKIGLMMDIREKEDEKRTERPEGLEKRDSLPLRTLRASQSVHIVLQAVKKMGYASGHVYASGLIVCSSTVSCHNTIGYSSIYTPCTINVRNLDANVMECSGRLQ